MPPVNYQNDISEFNPMLSRMSTTPQPLSPAQVPQAMAPQMPQGAHGLLPMLMQKMMGQAPSQLQEKQQAFQMQLQKEMQAHQAAMLESNYKMYNNLLKDANTRELAKAHGLPPEDFLAKVAPALGDNAKKFEEMKGIAMNAKGAQEEVNSRFKAEQQTQDVINRKTLEQNAGPNTISTIPGKNLQGNTTVQGPLVQQGVTQDRFGMIHPIQSAAPGNVSSSIPIDPSLKNDALQQNPLLFGLPNSGQQPGNDTPPDNRMQQIPTTPSVTPPGNAQLMPYSNNPNAQSGDVMMDFLKMIGNSAKSAQQNNPYFLKSSF